MSRKVKLAIVATLIAMVAIVPSTFGMHLQAKGRSHSAIVHFHAQ